MITHASCRLAGGIFQFIEAFRQRGLYQSRAGLNLPGILINGGDGHDGQVGDNG